MNSVEVDGETKDAIAKKERVRILVQAWRAVFPVFFVLEIVTILIVIVFFFAAFTGETTFSLVVNNRNIVFDIGIYTASIGVIFIADFIFLGRLYQLQRKKGDTSSIRAVCMVVTISTLIPLTWIVVTLVIWLISQSWTPLLILGFILLFPTILTYYRASLNDDAQAFESATSQTIATISLCIALTIPLYGQIATGNNDGDEQVPISETSNSNS